MKNKLKKQICLITAFILICCFSMSKITLRAEETPGVSENPEATATATPPTPTEKPKEDNVNSHPELKAESGYYEELDISEDWTQDKEISNKYTKHFYIENHIENTDDIFLLKIENFDSAYTVYINGNKLSSSVLENEITSYVKQGENLLEIQANKILGTIKVIYTPLVVVGSVVVAPVVKDGTVTVDISVRNRSNQEATGKIEVSVYELGIFKDGKRATHIGVGSAETEYRTEGKTTELLDPVTITIRDFDETRAWRTNNPFLYDVVVRMGNNSTVVRFGMRNIEALEGESYVTQNGEPLFVFALNIDEDIIKNAGDVTTYLAALMQYNINMVVGDNVVFGDEWYSAADEVGMLIYEADDLICNSVSPFDDQNKAYSFPTLAKITSEDKVTDQQIADFRLERKYCGILVSAVEEAEGNFNDVGIAVEFPSKTYGRGEDLVLDISLINDLNVDMKAAMTTVSLMSGDEVLLTETKEYESLKKLGTTGRDILTREFSFQVPNTIKNGSNLVIEVVVEYEETSRKLVVPIEIFGGETYESPYSQVIVIVGLSVFGAVVSMGIIGSLIKRRVDKRK